ncbi:MAG: ribosome maturation factor RimM [Alphaproteobacteria bacterium]
MARLAANQRATDRMPAAGRLVCLGEIVGPHGVRGAVRVKSFAATPGGLAAYGALSDASGRRKFELRLIGESRGALIAQIEGVDDRDAAEALRGTRLYVGRDALPAPEPDDFYHVDLIGLRVVDTRGEAIGRVRDVLDLPAGAVLEIEREDGDELLLPFTRAAVPTVDLDAGLMVVDLPAEVGPQ